LRRNAYLDRLKELDRQAEQVVERGELGKLDWGALKAAAACCRECPLHEAATGTVFGEGPVDARIMVVGEQPGDEEDLTGRVFVGPAGKLLDAALAEAGLVRGELYLTNAVKHFKWRREGKGRLHQSPNAGEISKCRPWLLAELERIRPEVVICLGGTAAKSLIDPQFKVLSQRGLVHHPDLAPRVIATVHPSYLLRLRTGVEEERRRFVDELRLAR
jgi:DNA polymerase